MSVRRGGQAPRLNMQAPRGKVMLWFSKLAYLLVRSGRHISTAGEAPVRNPPHCLHLGRLGDSLVTLWG